MRSGRFDARVCFPCGQMRRRFLGGVPPEQQDLLSDPSENGCSDLSAGLVLSAGLIQGDEDNQARAGLSKRFPGTRPLSLRRVAARAVRLLCGPSLADHVSARDIGEFAGATADHLPEHLHKSFGSRFFDDPANYYRPALSYDLSPGVCDLVHEPRSEE